MSGIRISINQIEIFLTVARSRSISVAAKKLYITQPALSKWLHELEKTVGKELFVRNNRGVALTPEGELLYAKLHDPYHRFRVRIEQIALEGVENMENILRVGCLHDPEMIDAMSTFLSLYREAFPGEAAISELYNFGELREKLVIGDLDLVFTHSGDAVRIEGAGVRYLHGIDQFFWLPVSWPCPEFRAKKDYAALKGKPLLLEMRGGCEDAVKICRDHGFEPGRVKHVSSFLLLTYMIAQGEGFSIWGRYMPDVYADHLRRVPTIQSEGLPEAMVAAAWRKDDASPMVGRALRILDDPALGVKSEDLAKKGITSRW